MALDSFDSPESSTIAGATYDPGQEVLTVTFVGQAGYERSYTYGSIPASLWHEFKQATSKGAFFGRRIRPLFAGRKVS